MSALSARERLRRTVLDAQKTPGVGPTLQLAYRAGLRMTEAACRRHPGISGLVVRESEAGSPPTPGLSDLDLTVLFDQERVEERLQFFAEFGLFSRRLRQFVPMIGEWCLLSGREQIEALEVSGHGGLQSVKRARALFLRSEISSVDLQVADGRARARRTARDHLRDALLRIDYFARRRLIEYLRDPEGQDPRFAQHALAGVEKRLAAIAPAPSELEVESGPWAARLTARYARLVHWCDHCARLVGRLPGESAEIELTPGPSAEGRNRLDAYRGLLETLAGDRADVCVWSAPACGERPQAVLLLPDQKLTVERATEILRVAAEVRRRDRRDGLSGDVMAWPWVNPLMQTRAMWAAYRDLFPMETAAATHGPTPSVAAWKEAAPEQWAIALAERNVCLAHGGRREDLLHYWKHLEVRLAAYGRVIGGETQIDAGPREPTGTSLAEAYRATSRALERLREAL